MLEYPCTNCIASSDPPIFSAAEHNPHKSKVHHCLVCPSKKYGVHARHKTSLVSAAKLPHELIFAKFSVVPLTSINDCVQFLRTLCSTQSYRFWLGLSTIFYLHTIVTVTEKKTSILRGVILRDALCGIIE